MFEVPSRANSQRAQTNFGGRRVCSGGVFSLRKPRETTRPTRKTRRDQLREAPLPPNLTLNLSMRSSLRMVTGLTSESSSAGAWTWTHISACGRRAPSPSWGTDLSRIEHTGTMTVPKARHCIASFFSPGFQVRPLMKTAGYAISFARALPSTLYSTRTSMADSYLNREGTASLLPRDARNIAHARTLTHRMHLAALSAAYFFACVLHACSSSLGHQQVAMPSVPYARRRGRRSPIRCSSRRSPCPQREAKAKWSARAWCGVGRGPTRVHASGHDERAALSGGASRWVLRGGSSESTRTFAARRKITSIRATSPWGRAPSHPPSHCGARPPRRQQRRELRNGGPGLW